MFMNSNILQGQQPVVQPNTVQGLQQTLQQPIVQGLGDITQPQTVQTPTGYLTQEQVNSIVATRVNGLNQKISQLTAQLSQVTQQSNAFANELAGYKNNEVLTSEGVPDYLKDYVSFEANKLAVNGKSFADAVKEFKSANANLFNTPSVGVPSTGAVQQTPNTVPVGATGIATGQPNTPNVQQSLGLNINQPQPTAVGTQQPQLPNGLQSNPLQNNQGIQQPQLQNGIQANLLQNNQGIQGSQQLQNGVQVSPTVSTGATGGTFNPNAQPFDAQAFLRERFKVK